MEKSYQDINAETIDRWCADGWEWGVPISHEEYLAAKEGRWQVLLSPTKPVPHSWFGELNGKKVLGLASGGGQQMPIFAALGAECTVLDYSQHQLESEAMVARREGYEIKIIRADMTKPLPFPDDCFDLIFHPVSNCYVEQVEPIWRECFRVLKPGGALLAGLDNCVNFWFDDDEERIAYTMPFNPLVHPEQMALLERQDCGVQFSHTIDEQIGGQLKAGLMLTDVYEDTNGVGNLHEHNIPSFWVTRAVKPGK
ncbi:MAG: class I SAM-dependent methyltransferase [Firmicutes bacterium]|nr:class I SAM-dependent methyltransferase [Bacillota bacterium]MDY6159727.1 class I SAM-dependent methyltransferase [Candidatus Faecousia sp.]